MLVFMFMPVVAMRSVVVILRVLVRCGTLGVRVVEGIRPGEDQLQL